MSDDLQFKAKIAAAAFEALRESALLESSGRPASGTDPAFALSWHSGMTPAELARAALEMASGKVVEQATFRYGRVFCFACHSAECTHSQPSRPGEVFAGYSSLGTPNWEEFFNFLLSLGDPRTELLFCERPEILARVIGRVRLVNDQLLSFGKNSLAYRIWGQVVAGYLQLPDARSALTAQVVETPDRRLRLQIIAGDALRTALAETPADRRSPFFRFHDALNETRLQIETLNNSWQLATPAIRRQNQEQVREQLFTILRHLAHSLERKGRQEHRRTIHAETRGQQDRPVHVAFDDLQQAAAANIFRDTFRRSVIVQGKNGRCHVYTPAGRHVTSLTLGQDEIDGRQRRKRYLPLSQEEIDAFRRNAAELQKSNAR